MYLNFCLKGWPDKIAKKNIQLPSGQVKIKVKDSFGLTWL